MKKVFLIFLTLIIVVVGFFCFKIYSGTTSFSSNSKSLIIHENETNKEALTKLLLDSSIISDASTFETLGNQYKIWTKLKAGKFKFNNGDNLVTIVKKFRNNDQQEINLIINKLRQPQDLAKLIGKSFATDSATAYGVITDSTIVADLGMYKDSFLFNIIPNTYQFLYNTPVQKMLEKIAVESNKFWDNNNRLEKAKSLGYTPFQVCTIASIVEEETNKDDEKGKVASVYMNRVNKNMKLEADPTVKFALKDFTLKRILNVHLQTPSPYNTYQKIGLPPGAICTPSIKTIDATLNAPSTNYIFFCADSSFNGYHKFTDNYQEHLQNAKQYQQALTRYLLAKKNKN